MGVFFLLVSSYGTFWFFSALFFLLFFFSTLYKKVISKVGKACTDCGGTMFWNVGNTIGQFAPTILLLVCLVISAVNRDTDIFDTITPQRSWPDTYRDGNAQADRAFY